MTAAGLAGCRFRRPGQRRAPTVFRALGRPPQADELALAVAFVQRQTAANAADLGKWKGSPAAKGGPLLAPWGAARPGFAADE